MQTDTTGTEPSRQRHRHRSRRQKALESVGLVLGVPVLLGVVLALSVEMIEYRPIEDSATRYAQQTSSAARRANVRTPRIPDVVAETPQLTIEGEPTAR